MIYLLDTNTCIQYLNSRSSLVVDKLKTHNPNDIVLCDIVKLELYYGAYNCINNSTFQDLENNERPCGGNLRKGTRES